MMILNINTVEPPTPKKDNLKVPCKLPKEDNLSMAGSQVCPLYSGSTVHQHFVMNVPVVCICTVVLPMLLYPQ